MANTVEISYGRGKLSVDLDKYPAKAVLKVDPDFPHGLSVQESLEKPIGSARLSELTANIKRLLIITSDHTRPLPSKKTLPFLLKEARLKNPGLDIHILIATGCHRAMSEQEMHSRFGEELLKNETFLCHNAKADGDMVFKGHLPSGGELWMNKEVDWADMVVAEGFIEPHLYAGFSGGRKSILPGICSYKTVCSNHCAKFVNSPESRPGNLEGNRMHLDMLYAAQQAGLKFILNVVLSDEGEIIASFAGDSREAHEAGCQYVLAKQSLRPVKCDIAVTTNNGYPLDQNIYQSIKGMIAANRCVRDGGEIILAAECSEGHGSELFYSYFCEGLSTRELYEKISARDATETKLDQWQAQVITKILLRCHVTLVACEKNKEYAAKMGLDWCATLDEALEKAYARAGKNAELVVIPDGVSVIFP